MSRISFQTIDGLYGSATIVERPIPSVRPVRELPEQDVLCVLGAPLASSGHRPKLTRDVSGSG